MLPVLVNKREGRKLPFPEPWGVGGLGAQRWRGHRVWSCSSFGYKDLERRNLGEFPVCAFPPGCHFYVIMKLEASRATPVSMPIYLRGDTRPESLSLSWRVGKGTIC